MLKWNRHLLTVVVIGLTATGCATPPPQGITDADREEIRQTTQDALAIANGSKDFRQYAEVYYAPDIVVMPPNGEAVRGRDAVVAWNEGFPPYEDLRFLPQEIEGVGDMAYVYGTYSMVMTLPGQEDPISDHGKYLEIWRRQADGSWKVARDIFNSDLPLPEG